MDHFRPTHLPKAQGTQGQCARAGNDDHHHRRADRIGHAAADAHGKHGIARTSQTRGGHRGDQLQRGRHAVEVAAAEAVALTPIPRMPTAEINTTMANRER